MYLFMFTVYYKFTLNIVYIIRHKNKHTKVFVTSSMYDMICFILAYIYTPNSTNSGLSCGISNVGTRVYMQYKKHDIIDAEHYYAM